MRDMRDLVHRALIFATEKHEGQIRDDEQKTPAICHAEEVAKLVYEFGGDEEEVAAALLHDVVEDTDTTIKQISDEFGRCVANIVDGLTDLPEMEGMSLDSRKALQAYHLLSESDSVKLIKLADQTSNMRSIATQKMAWSSQRCLEYALGARLVADCCKDRSPELYARFIEYFDQAIQVHSGA